MKKESKLGIFDDIYVAISKRVITFLSLLSVGP